MACTLLSAQGPGFTIAGAQLQRMTLRAPLSASHCGMPCCYRSDTYFCSVSLHSSYLGSASPALFLLFVSICVFTVVCCLCLSASHLHYSHLALILALCIAWLSLCRRTYLSGSRSLSLTVSACSPLALPVCSLLIDRVVHAVVRICLRVGALNLVSSLLM